MRSLDQAGLDTPTGAAESPDERIPAVRRRWWRRLSRILLAIAALTPLLVKRRLEHEKKAQARESIGDRE
jgi:hypothetical protein